VYKRISYHRAVVTSPVPSTIHHPRGFIRRPTEILQFTVPFIAALSNAIV
jgi:hypothetical protein